MRREKNKPSIPDEKKTRDKEEERDKCRELYIYVFLNGKTDYVSARILFKNSQRRDKEQFYLSTTDKYK